MKSVGRKLGWWVPLAAMGALTLLAAQPARTQAKVTYPQWERDSGVIINNPPANFPLTNKYLALWEYYAGSDISRFNIWTNLGDPLNDGDNYITYYKTDTSGNITYECPWGSRLFSSQRPTPCVSDGSGGTTGDDRPLCNVLSLHVADPTNTANNGFTDFLFPEDGSAVFAPPRVDLADGQGYFAPYRFTSGSNIALEVTQKTEFARDMMRIEVSIKNNGGSTATVGARLLLDPFVDNWVSGNFNAQPTKSVYLPNTLQRITYETEFRGAQIPGQWQMFDDDTGQQPNYIAKGYLANGQTSAPGQILPVGQYGATTPSRVIFGNTLDMYPYVLAKTNPWYWTTRTDFELRIADIGLLIYWDPISIPAGQSRSFVTYGGVGVAEHGMSDAYVITHQGKPDPNSAGSQGFIGAIQTPFALPLVSGAADVDSTGAPLTYNIDAYLQNESIFQVTGATANIPVLPDALQFVMPGVTNPQQLLLANASPVGRNSDESHGVWKVQATGVSAGLVPIDVIFTNGGFRDSAQVRRMINVPQGNLYQFDDNWRMVTFPFTFAGLNNDPAVALGFPAGTPFQIVRYNPESTAANPYEVVTAIQPGESYWVRMLGTGTTFTRLQNATPIKSGVTDPSGTAPAYSTALARGWNQVGDPSPYAVAVRDLKLFTVGQTTTGGSGNGTGLPPLITYDQAVTQGWIRPTLYAYDRKTNAYVPLGRDAVIQPGQGVWIYATGNRSLYWPSPIGPKLSITP